MRLGKQEIFHASIIYAKIDYTTKQLYKHTSRFCESQVFAKKNNNTSRKWITHMFYMKKKM